MLELQHLFKTFNPGTPDAKLALNDLSFAVHDGDFVTIIGANGAGKSTLFNAIAGSFITDAGRIFLDGKDITLQAEHKRARTIGRIFQDPMRGSAPGMTIEENLALASGRGGWMHRTSQADRRFFREKVALLGMGLEDRMNQPVGLLSGGQRQALTLLMATATRPQLLLLDECTAALDPGTAEKVLALVNRIVGEEHLTCLMITHDMQAALDLGNRTIMMNNGQIVMDVENEERCGLTISDLLLKFKEAAGKELSNDRMLLT
ncbi:MAG TPA: ABC transporter ATP-binding protein [Clostridiales bacterium]|nr:ABC transporter ATP-binding protein [Clostridiales bacterium]